MTGDGEAGRRGFRALAYAWLAVLSLFILLATAVTLFGNPQAATPSVEIALAPQAAPARPHAAVSAPAAPSAAASTLLAAPPEAGEPAEPPRLVPAAVTAPVRVGGALLADPALIEQTPQGPLPRIAGDGTMPMHAYAAAVPQGSGPRIAIVISGLGISAKATKAALDGLPAGVTLAFAPYAQDVQNWVSLARAKGHEVLLELPMEPYDFPDSDPGPHTLRAGSGEDSNTARLVWALTRFTGYAGVTNLLGGRFLADADALAPVMTYLTRRGLLFYDNGSALHSVAPDIAARAGAAFAQATTTIDTIQTAMEIDRQLSALEAQARAKGSASGAGFLYPVTIDRVAEWAKGLSGRGFVLAPASAIVTAPKS